MSGGAPTNDDPHRKVSRLPGLPRPLDPNIAALLEETRSRGGDVLNLHLVNAHAPRVSKVKRALTFALRSDCSCPRLYRELAICRTAVRLGCDYELGHHLPLLRRAGLSEEAAEAIVDWRARTDLYDARQRAVLAYVDEICANQGAVADGVFSGISDCFSPQEIVELTLTATYYYANGLFMKALGVVRDDPRRHPAPGAF